MGVIRRSTASLAAVCLLAAGLVAAGAAMAPQSASAEPGNPGVAEDPTVVFEEGFENRSDNEVQLLGDYVGADGQTYSADVEWSSLEFCNGFVLSPDSPNPGGCEAWNGVVSAATAMQAYNGSDSSLAAYTDGDPGANLVQLATDAPVELDTVGRFLTFSVDAVAVNCYASAPLLRFSLGGVDGGETPVSDAAINPCAEGDAAGTFASSGSFLSDGDEIDVVLRNENGSGAGNDHAIDNIRILDATPKLDKAFGEESWTTGASFPVTFTVTNTSEVAEKSGWSFTDALSDGLTVADDPAVESTCSADVTAEAGADEIVVSNGALAVGEESCEITVDVVAGAAGEYVNGPDNITSIVGLENPDDSTVTIEDGEPLFFACNEYITFGDQDAAEQWRRRTTTDGFTQHHSADNMNWAAEGGNPGGHLWSEDWEGGSITEMLTPELAANGYETDYGFADGEALQFDYRNEAGIEFPVYAAVEGANGERYFYTFADQIADETGWNTIRLPLVASEWVTGWTGSNAGPDLSSPTPTEEAFAAVLENVDHFGFAVESTTRLDELTRFDNFGRACPVLEVDKSADAEGVVLAGDTVDYTVTASNTGGGDFTAELPASVSDDMSDVLDDAAYNGDAAAVASDGSGVPVPVVDGTELTWSGPIASGETVTITYSVTVTNAGDHDLVNIASGQCPDGIDCPDPGASVEVPLPHVTPSKSSDPASGESVAAGEEIAYTVTFANAGQAAGPVDSTDDLSGVLDDAALSGQPVVDEAHAEAITAVVDGEELRIEGDLAAGETATVTYSVTVDADGERGDDVVGNVVVPDRPPFVPDPDCEDCAPFEPPTTEHPVQHTPETEAPVEEPDENESLAVTGGETAWGVVAGGLMLLLAGGVLMAVRRQSRLS